MKIYSKKFNSIVEKLKGELLNSDRYSHKHACALLKGGKILDITNNNVSNRIANHAEQKILLKQSANRQQLRKCVLFVVRIVKGNETASSKPCFHCINIIKEFGIKKICFSTNHGFEIKKISELENNHIALQYRC